MTTDSLVDTSQMKEKAGRLLKTYGSDTLSYFHLQEERQYFFSPSRKSFLSYKVFNKVAIVAADPVGAPSEIESLLHSFLQYTKTWKLLPCFIGFSHTYVMYLQKYGLQTTKIGEEAILSVKDFERNKLKKKVKQSIKHVERQGIEVFFFSPKNLPDSIRKQLEMISYNWIQRKGGKEKGFSMTLKRLPNEYDEDCIFVVAMKESIAIGYLCFVPIYRAKALSLDQARRESDAPNGLNEFLIIHSVEYFKERGIEKMSLNFAAFSRIENKGKNIIATIYTMLGNLYTCNSLRQFNEKFSPSWENRYMAYTRMKHMPLYILAIVRAER